VTALEGPGGRDIRPFAFGALLVAALVLGFVLFKGSQTSYVIHARFQNAGQVVKGGVVQIAGRKVGSVTGITLTDNGLADLELKITDDGAVPLHRGTRAAIRAVGQAGVANRFVDLSPGPKSNAKLDDGAVLGTEQTQGIVDLDAFLATLDPPARSDVQNLIRNSSAIFAGSGSKYFNGMLAKLAPALAETQRFTGEIADDRAQLARLVRSAGRAAAALGSRRTDLEGAVVNSARALRAIASERVALADVLTRAPGVLRQGRGTLSNLEVAVTALRPALRDIPATAIPLREFLGRVDSTLGKSRPVVSDLNRQLPNLRRSLAGLVPLEAPALKALSTTAAALRDARPILAGIRIYGSDFMLGIINGLAGVATGNYNGQGHYAGLEFTQPFQTFFGGLGAGLFNGITSLPNGVINTRTGLTARCPGGNTPPAPDGSSPWIPDPSLCRIADDQPASLNTP
jgi:phospholipid/cholesterol/gamma-HCH transport system substrate-binding protein